MGTISSNIRCIMVMVMISQYVGTTGNPCHYPSIRPFRYDVIIDQSQPTVQVLSSPYTVGSENPTSNRSMLYKNFYLIDIDSIVLSHLPGRGSLLPGHCNKSQSHWCELCDGVPFTSTPANSSGTLWCLLHRLHKQLKVILAASTSFLFWPHFGLWKTWQQNFIADGIHFIPTSPGKYSRSIRGAVLRAARQLQEECGNRFIIAHSPALLELAPGSFHATIQGMIMRRSAQNPNISQF